MDDAAMDAELHAAGGRFRLEHSAIPHSPQTADFDVTAARHPGPPRRRWTALIAAAVIVALAGTGSWLAFRGGGGSSNSGTEQAGSADGLAGWQWTLTSVDTGGSTGSAYSSSLNIQITGGGPSVTFGPDEVIGSDGCNDFSGSADVSADVIKLGAVAVSAVGCPPAANGQDFQTVLDSFFTGSITWSITGDTLTLVNGSTTLHYARGSRAEFGQPSDGNSATSSTVPTDPNQLVGRWQLQQVAQESASSGSGSGSSDGYDSYLTFTTKGFAVDDRCYSTAGAATLNATTIDFGPAHDTRTIPCTSPMNEETAVDQQVDSTLSGTAKWAINDGTLTITKGDSTLTYTAAPASSPGSGPTS